jgi:hypothetical protein
MGAVLHRTDITVPRFVTVPPLPDEGDGPDRGLVLQRTHRDAVVVVPAFNEVVSLEVYDGATSPAAVRRLERPAVQPMERAIADHAVAGSPASQAGTLSVLIMASGYDTARMSRFRRTARRIKRYLLSRAPFSKRAGRIRLAVHENTDPLGCASGCGGIGRLICCDDLAVIEAAVSSGSGYDEIIVVHDDLYGGGGLVDDGTGYRSNSYSTYAVTYGRRDKLNLQEELAVHEFGHSFGNLCDEYQGDGTFAHPCVNCQPSCASWSPIGSGCNLGCGASPELWRPEDSIMRDLTRRQFNIPSIRATYFPEGLAFRLGFFLSSPTP